jgi:pilus assembly protein CpaC
VKKVRRVNRGLAILAGAMVLMTAALSATGQQAVAPSSGSSIVVDGNLDAGGKLRVGLNKTTVVNTRARVARVSIGSPEIADVNVISPTTLLITAKKMGTTQLIVWDDTDHSQTMDIVVEFDLAALQEQYKAMFPGSKIEATATNGAIALRGHVPNLKVAAQAVALAEPYSQKVINFLEISGGQQVMLQVRFAEVSRSASSALGINGNYASGAFVGGSNIGQVNPSSRLPADGVVGVTPPFNGVELNGATTVNPGVTVFGAGQIGNFYFEYFIQALRQNNLLRVLAEPNLMAMSGETASFLAGGEFPVPVTQGGGQGGVAVTVEYREFGVRLKFIPVVLGDGRIQLKVAPEVSDLDFTTAVRLNGFVIPGLTSRKMETSVELAEGQTLAIAGLLNNNVTASKDVTPLLGDLPVVGTLFRSVRYQRKETELVVLVTPRLVAPMNPEEVPLLPGEKWNHPAELDLFLNQNIGGEQAVSVAPMTIKEGSSSNSGPTTRQAAAVDRVPARFRGQYGFIPTSQPVASASDE